MLPGTKCPGEFLVSNIGKEVAGNASLDVSGVAIGEERGGSWHLTVSGSWNKMDGGGLGPGAQA